MSDGDKAVNKALAAALFRNWLRSKPARTLDVGSRHPYLAHCLQGLGCEAYGLDPVGTGDLNVPLLAADFETVSEDQIQAWTQTGKFGLITMVHVFEHMYDPLGALRTLRKLIADEGVLFVRLPDHGVSGFERDLTSSHYTIHPFFHSLPSFLELLVQGQDLFTVVQTYALPGAGQRDIILRPIVRKPVIYAGLIVKNEERDLPRCLRSIEDVADGVVLVDTGSTDATLEVAQRVTTLPMHVQTYTGASRLDEAGDWKIWDFSKARNVFVREIEERGADYVLWVDADDELLSPRQLRRALYWDQYNIFGVQIESRGSRWIHHRMWKTKRGIRFQGRCHEYPEYGGFAAMDLTDVIVRHHQEPGAGENSNARNMRILLEEFAEAPSPRTAFYLANTYKDAKRYEEAIPWYERRIAFGGIFRDEWLFAHLYKARCQRWMEDFAGARLTAHQALVAAPDWSEFWMELAYCAYDQYNCHEAIGYALNACDKPQPPTQLWREPDKYTDQPPRIISWCYEHLGDADNALTWAFRARDKIGKHDNEWEARIARLQRGELYKDEESEIEGPVGGGPVVEGPVGGGPVGEGLVVGGPVVGGPVVGGPVVGGPVVGGPVVKGPVVGGPVVEGPVVGGPVVEAPFVVGGPTRRRTVAPRPKIAICRPGALGDVLMTLNLVPALREKWPDHDVHYLCHPSIGAKLESVLLAAGISEIGDSRRRAGAYVRVFNLVGYPLHEGYPEKPMRRHLLDYFADELGVASGTRPSLQLPLRPGPLGNRAPYATLQVQTGWSVYKNWPVERWAEVVRVCPEIPIYQIGAEGEPLVEGACHDFMGAPLDPTIALFANATIHLGLDSFANHLTHYLWEGGGSVRRVPAVILWGSTQVSALGYDHNTNISLGLPCQPCFREDPAISRMPRGPCINPPGQIYAEPRHACMFGIETDRVAQAVKERWELALRDGARVVP